MDSDPRHLRVIDKTDDGLGALTSVPLGAILESEIRNNLSAYRELASEFGFGFRFGDKTCFDHTKHEIVVGVDDLVSLGVRDIEAFHFAVLHEIKHYQDLASDPQSYQRLIAKGTRDDGLGRLYFGLYNCTEDITVNRRNSYDSALFRGEDDSGFSELIVRTYRENFFSDRDFSEIEAESGKLKQLFCQQYAHYILNLGMGAADDITVSPEVREVIERPIDIYGKRYSLQDFIDTVLTPAPKSEEAKIGNSLNKRNELVAEYLEPRFEELLQKDREREGEESVREREVSFGAPRGASIEDIERATKYIIEKNGEEEKSPAQRNAEKLQKQRETLASQAGLDPEEAKDFLERLRRLDPVIRELRDFWLTIPQNSVETELVYDGPRKSGIKPNIQDLVRNSLGITLGDPNIRFMEKQIEVESLYSSPKRIRVHLVIDVSGSMQEHMETVADLAVALGVSFQSANATASIEGLDFNCEVESVTFGETAQHVVELTPQVSLVQIMSAYKLFFEYQGETRDHLAYELIARNLNSDELELRRSGELFDFVLVVTDGEPAASDIDSQQLIERSRKGLAGLEQAGLVVKAFGIGEIAVFDQIWNSDGKIRGQQIGSARKLLPVTRELFGSEIAQRYPGLSDEK